MSEVSDAIPYELSSMAHARNYYDWLSRVFGHVLHGTVIEQGAGIGLLTERLRKRYEMRLVLVEPDPDLQRMLSARFADANTEVFAGTVEELNERRGNELADAVVSTNVLEHVGDDVRCLGAIANVLKPGGHLCLYVPARPELFGSLDTFFGHQRRYARSDLVAKLESAGLRVQWARYRNLVGALGWWFSGRVLKRRDLPAKQVRFYDSYVFPLADLIESRLPPPYGQNLLVLARKDSGGGGPR
jgi:SAM-dependent methyltransferase